MPNPELKMPLIIADINLIQKRKLEEVKSYRKVLYLTITVEQLHFTRQKK